MLNEIRKLVDREGIEPSTSSLRTRHYTPKPPALELLHRVVFLFIFLTHNRLPGIKFSDDV